MKGPSLPYELRVLRVFRCGACGREVHLPGNATSHVCYCTDPPKFMQPQERPVTRSPDVSAFLSPADPSELVDEVETEEEPHVPYIPKLPPRPPQFPSRRKLSEEIDKFVPPEFGDGLESVNEVNNEESEQARLNAPSSRRGPSEHGGERKDRSDRRGGRGRDQSDRRPERRPDPSARHEQPSRSDTNRAQRSPHGTSPQQASVPSAGLVNDSANTPIARSGEDEQRSERGRRGRRRRGRERGAVDAHDSGSPLSNATVVDSSARDVSEQSPSDDDFGSGLDAAAGAALPRSSASGSSPSDRSPSSNPVHRSSQRSQERKTAETLNNAVISDHSSDDDTDESDDGPDEGEIEQSSGDPSASRRRRNRRRGRRRGRGANGGDSGSGADGASAAEPGAGGSGPNGSTSSS